MHSLWDVLLSVSCNIYFKQNNEAFQHQTFYNQNTCKCHEYGSSENKSVSSKPSGFTLEHHTICQVNFLVFCEISNCSNGREKPKISMINNKAKCLKHDNYLVSGHHCLIFQKLYLRGLDMFLSSGEQLVGGGVPPQIRQKTAISIFVPMVDPHRPDQVTWPHFHPIYFEPKDGGSTVLWRADLVQLQSYGASQVI